MFVDEAKITVTAGRGGDGMVHFRKEKFIPKGGPDGGDGGRGGDVYFMATANAHTLYDFRFKKKFKAENGKPGDKNNRTGRGGEDLVLEVPLGTMITDTSDGRTVADLDKPGQKIKVAEGGVGGKGNAGFVNSIRQAPKFAELGDQGQTLDLQLELKLVADVALVGYPSVGKSTFISVVSNARPKVGDYPFTTLIPNLGVAKVDDRELVFVDVPGLIEGAHEGKGLGHTFLRHIERAHFVLHLIDIASDTPLQDFKVIRAELEKFSPRLAEKPFLPVFTKIDLSDTEFEYFLIKEFEVEYGVKPLLVSAVTHEGVQPLLHHLLHEIPEEQSVEELTDDETEKEEMVEYRPGDTVKADSRRVEITKRENWWDIENDRLAQMSRQTVWESLEAKERLYDVLRKWNVTVKLDRAGAVPGDLIRIGEGFLEYRGV